MNSLVGEKCQPGSYLKLNVNTDHGKILNDEILSCVVNAEFNLVMPSGCACTVLVLASNVDISLVR